jgi:Holliday junction resolvase RusA-like endonuclease
VSKPYHYIKLVIDGKAHGQSRTGGNGKVRFTPKGTRDHALRVQGEWIACGRPRIPGERYYKMMVTSVRSRPESHWLKSGELSSAGKDKPFPGKPDIDNEVKAILDALVACGAIPDDRYCVELNARKEWGYRQEGERVTIFAYTMDHDSALDTSPLESE